MIGTLFAQEFRATKKSLVAATGTVVLVAAVSLVFAALNVPVLGSLGLFLGIAGFIVLVPVILCLLAESYWRTMYGREGYFTMVIPVRGRTLFTAKLVYGLLISVVAMIVTAVGLLGAAFAFALSLHKDPWTFIGDGLADIQPWMVWLGVSTTVLQVAYLVVAGSALMTIGAEGRFNHLGFGAPVIGAVALYLVMQVVTFIGILFIPLGIRLTGPDAGELVPQGMLDGVMAAIADPASQPDVLGLGFVFTTIATMVLLAWWGGRSVERHTSLR
ncbi:MULTISPECIES: hypothetical protein [unclassified Microbacterium]|uniref:hypothetical protein n=1 Tax=unclassified Microbacterium TaxID=2609290 RepID=UPI0012F81807|nr:hypothetical protein [Microbacterium sp. MAH-37]MVQ41229.1 hypothetical protein [Microbacterium sp. MAH-37]